MTSAVLFSDADRSVLLVDIPRSLEVVQGMNNRLKSSIPLERPHQPTEPKEPKRNRILQQSRAGVLAHHDEVSWYCRRALRSIEQNWDNSSWCLPRVLVGPADDAGDPSDIELHLYPLTRNSTHRPLGLQGDHAWPIWSPLVVLSPSGNQFRDITDFANTAVQNPSHYPTTAQTGHQTFYVPPFSTFILATVAEGLSAFANALQIFPQSDSTTDSHGFDMILLDPPWPNRSARRGRQYRTSERQESDPFHQSLPILQNYVNREGIVCIWITNKASIREMVMSFLNKIDFELCEEWTWLKVTTRGQPVYPLDGIWKKPYEILLLFRRRGSSAALKRRVVIAVPDIHSRKPCLKALLESHLPRPYTALELFARNLVEGWWSWGDEVLKFQHQQFWSDAEDAA